MWQIKSTKDSCTASISTHGAWVSTDAHDIIFYFTDNLNNYPWIVSVSHLERINKYRKRVGQHQLMFNDNDIAELVLLGGV